MKPDPLDYLAYLVGFLLGALYTRGIVTGSPIDEKAVMPLATILGGLVTAIVTRNKDRRDREKERDEEKKKGGKDASD